MSIENAFWSSRLHNPNNRLVPWPEWVDRNASNPTKVVANRYVLGEPFSRGKNKVFLAFDTKLEKLVVLKQNPNTQFATGLSHREEAEFPDSTNSSEGGFEYSPTFHCVPVYNFIKDEQTGAEFIVMQYMDPKHYSSLETTVDAQLHPYAAVQIVLALLRVVNEWYQHGFFHRDLCPDNIFVGLMWEEDYSDCRVVLSDFTLALNKGQFDEKERSLKDEASMYWVGTPAYSPPEIRKDFAEHGLIPTEAAYVWIVGAILADMLGKKRETPSMPGFSFGSNPSNSSYFNKLIQAGFDANDLDEVVEKCLEKNPSDRFQSLAELIEALESQIQNNPGLRTVLASPGSQTPVDTADPTEQIHVGVVPETSEFSVSNPDTNQVARAR